MGRCGTGVKLKSGASLLQLEQATEPPRHQPKKGKEVLWFTNTMVGLEERPQSVECPKILAAV